MAVIRAFRDEPSSPAFYTTCKSPFTQLLPCSIALSLHFTRVAVFCVTRDEPFHYRYLTLSNHLLFIFFRISSSFVIDEFSLSSPWISSFLIHTLRLWSCRVYFEPRIPQRANYVYVNRPSIPHSLLCSVLVNLTSPFSTWTMCFHHELAFNRAYDDYCDVFDSCTTAPEKFRNALTLEEQLDAENELVHRFESLCYQCEVVSDLFVSWREEIKREPLEVREHLMTEVWSFLDCDLRRDAYGELIPKHPALLMYHFCSDPTPQPLCITNRNPSTPTLVRTFTCPNPTAPIQDSISALEQPVSPFSPLKDASHGVSRTVRPMTEHTEETNSSLSLKETRHGMKQSVRPKSEQSEEASGTLNSTPEPGYPTSLSALVQSSSLSVLAQTSSALEQPTVSSALVHPPSPSVVVKNTPALEQCTVPTALVQPSLIPVQPDMPLPSNFSIPSLKVQICEVASQDLITEETCQADGCIAIDPLPIPFTAIPDPCSANDPFSLTKFSNEDRWYPDSLPDLHPEMIDSKSTSYKFNTNDRWYPDFTQDSTHQFSSGLPDYPSYLPKKHGRDKPIKNGLMNPYSLKIPRSLVTNVVRWKNVYGKSSVSRTSSRFLCSRGGRNDVVIR